MFASEAAWPFRLHGSQLASCLEFLERPGRAPRVLRIFGSSGGGKSFLVRELMVQAAGLEKDGVGLYLDVPPGDLEASAILNKLDALLNEPREASRDAPSFVSKKAGRSWISTKRGTSAKRKSYGYRASRDLTGQIPLAGPFIKALLPESGEIRSSPNGGATPLSFLMRRSRSRQVLLVIDNIQFLPFAVRDMLSTELAASGTYLRLVLIERVHGDSRMDWNPSVIGADLMEVVLGKATIEEVAELVREVMPEADDHGDIAATIFRRSDGNLKSVWFQLRLIASRREDQGVLPLSYEGVILTLPPFDQAVLRFIVFTIGGLTLASLVSLLRVTDLRARPDAVTGAIADLASLGLLVVNGDRADRVRVEHELVAQVVSETTPEDEKLELRSQIVTALSTVLDEGATPNDESVLYDRLLGIVNQVELRQTPSLLSHIVTFVQIQSDLERHRYLSSICRDSVCWDVLDTLPETTVRALLDAIQKSALFDFGLVATARLRRISRLHESLASLYEAKYLVQLFRYDEATAALERVRESKEKRAVLFNIMLNLAQDDRAAEVAMEVYAEISEATGTDQDYVILRNAVHLFGPSESLDLVEASITGFQALGHRFGAATGLNNRGIVDLASGTIASARGGFELARRELEALESAEVYQPLVNLSAVALLEGHIGTARRLLAAARDATPRSLLQDAAMLDMNEVALDICGGVCSGVEVMERMEVVVRAARKIRDLRFHIFATWFAESLEAVVSGRPTAGSPSSAKVHEIRTCGRVALEVFVASRLEGSSLEVPFMLSPHWRY
jgi:hypothetical protein